MKNLPKEGFPLLRLERTYFLHRFSIQIKTTTYCKQLAILDVVNVSICL